MDAPEHIEHLKHEIANLTAMLAPLEAGRVQIGTTRSGEPWTEMTASWIAHLRRTIALHQAAVDFDADRR